MFEIIFFFIAGLFLLGSIDDFMIDIAYAFLGMRPQKITSDQWSTWRAQNEKL